MTGTEKFHNYTGGIFKEHVESKTITHIINIIGWYIFKLNL